MNGLTQIKVGQEAAASHREGLEEGNREMGLESVPPQHPLAGLAHSACTPGGGLGPGRSAIHAAPPPPELPAVLEVVLDRFTLL